MDLGMHSVRYLMSGSSYPDSYMKILLLNQVFYPDPVATAQHTRDLALYLQHRGHEVTVVAGRRNYERREIQYAAEERLEGVRIFRVGSTGLGKRSVLTRIVDSITFFLALVWRLVRLRRFDLVISFTSPPLIGVFGVLFCLLRGGKHVQWLMDVNPDAAIAVGYLKKGSLVERGLTAAFRFTLARSAKLVVLDRWMEKRISTHGARAEQFAIVPPWPVQKLETPPPDAGQLFRREHANLYTPFRAAWGWPVTSLVPIPQTSIFAS